MPGPINPRDLLNQPLIMTGCYQTDGILTHLFWHSLGQLLRLAYEVSQPQSLVELVRAQLGIGVTTVLVVNVSRVSDLVVRAINDELSVRDVCLYCPKTEHYPLPANYCGIS